MDTAYPHFDDMVPVHPDMDQVKVSYQAILDGVLAAQDDDRLFDLVQDWDKLRRGLAQWATCVSVRFAQDTRDEEAKRNQELLDTTMPEFTRLDTGIQRALVEHTCRAGLEARLGAQAFALWDCDLAAFEPSIQSLLVEENKLISEYSKTISNTMVTFRDKPHTLRQLSAYLESSDRALRYDALRAYYEALGTQEEAIDGIFDKLVKLRHQIATSLGYDNFVPLGYQRMKRIDYDEADVEKFKNEVLEHIVPLRRRVNELQRQRLKLDKLMIWDSSVFSLNGNPAPGGDHHWMMDAAEAFFDDFNADFAALYRLMRDRGLLDLDNREGKNPGGFCNVFYEFGLPFIFANFDRTTADVSVFTHEMGHAFQSWSSRDVPLLDYVWPTIETAEIPSMTLEFLTLPYLKHFLGERAEEFIWIQLARTLRVLISCALGDEFQARIYRDPDMTPAQRRALWQELSEQYYPDSDSGDLKELAAGRRWHAIGHFFFAPFYYIDYALANAVALQFWTLSRDDNDEAMARYVKLCKSGGSRPFQATLDHVEMTSPFSKGSMTQIASTVASVLNA